MAEPARPLVAITFDDGPSSKVTPRILELLAQYHVTATFSVVGDHVAFHPEMLRQMTAQGCEIVNHSWAHEKFTDLSEEQITESVLKTEEKIWNACGKHTVFVRPPGGHRDSRTSDVLKKLGKAQLSWNVDPRDWESRDAGKIVQAVLDSVKDESAVIMHDLYPSTYEAAAVLIPALLERGFALVTASELLRIKGIPVIPGERYFHFHRDP